MYMHRCIKADQGLERGRASLDRTVRECSPEGDLSRDPDEVREGSEPRPGEGPFQQKDRRRSQSEGPAGWASYIPGSARKPGWGSGASPWRWQNARQSVPKTRFCRHGSHGEDFGGMKASLLLLENILLAVRRQEWKGGGQQY